MFWHQQVTWLPACTFASKGRALQVADRSVSVVLLAGGVGKRMGVRPLGAVLLLTLQRSHMRIALRSGTEPQCGSRAERIYLHLLAG